MKKTKSKAKGSTKRRRYSADERALYLLGYWDTGADFPSGSRMNRLQNGDEYLFHPSYKAGKKSGEKSIEKSKQRFANSMRRAATLRKNEK